MQSYCPFFFTTIADTCIMANLPRCSTMPNTTPMSVTLRNRQHQVRFSAALSEPGKQLSGGFRGGKGGANAPPFGGE